MLSAVRRLLDKLFCVTTRNRVQELPSMRRSFIAAALIAGQLSFSSLTGCQQAAPPVHATTAARSDSAPAFAPQTYAIPPSKNVQFELQARIIDAVPGDVIQLEEGCYELQRQLDVAADNVTIRPTTTSRSRARSWR